MRRTPHRRGFTLWPWRDETGQTAVETALTLPLMIFFLLGVIQLGMLHQAQLMTEYAAYRAVRAGIVNDGDCEIMAKAAMVSLAPTLPPLPGLRLFGAPGTLQRMMELYAQTLAKRDDLPFKVFRLEVTSLPKAVLLPLFNRYGSHLAARELDFDDVRDDNIIRANQLTVRVRYFYKMRIPFANALIHAWYMGRAWLLNQKGVQFESQEMGGAAANQVLESLGAPRDEDHQLMAALTQPGAGPYGGYYLPVQATYTMRMQSNLFLWRVAQCSIDR